MGPPEQMGGLNDVSIMGPHPHTNANINAAVEQATKLMSVKSPMEFFALSNDYAKRHFVTLTRQAQELAAIVQKMTIAKDHSADAKGSP
jgi:hypothetical protein